jgi:hypothetical protein
MDYFNGYPSDLTVKFDTVALSKIRAKGSAVSPITASFTITFATGGFAISRAQGHAPSKAAHGINHHSLT